MKKNPINTYQKIARWFRNFKRICIIVAATKIENY